jgi:hypothetical protein
MIPPNQRSKQDPNRSEATSSSRTLVKFDFSHFLSIDTPYAQEACNDVTVQV